MARSEAALFSTIYAHVISLQSLSIIFSLSWKSLVLSYSSVMGGKKVFLGPFKLYDHIFPFFLFVKSTIISCLFSPLE